MAKKYKLEEGNISYSGDVEILRPFGNKIAYNNYNYDENGNIIYHKPIINAIDIDWQNAEVPGFENKISTTSDLLNEISNIASKNTELTSVPYIKNGNWWIGNIDTKIPATGENGLTPYIKDGYWYIGKSQICPIDGTNEGFTPYISYDGYWYINGVKTNIKAEGAQGTSGNTPYVGENGNWWIGTTDLGISAKGNAGADGNTPWINDDGYWCIGNINTGIKAISNNLINNNYYPYEGSNGNWWIKTSNGDIDTGVPVRQQIPQGASDGIPIYDTEMINQHQAANTLPNKYISIDDSLHTSNNQSQIEILLATVNALQQEVTKLKNTFTKGIYSYNNEATYMSSVVKGYGDIDSEEPLWAIDESDLDIIENFEFNIEESKKYVDDGILNDVDDQRMFAYMTVDSPDVQVVLCKRNDTSTNISFNFKDYIDCGKCNIMLIVSRLPEDKSYPANYIYFVITDYTTNNTLLKGYLDNTLSLNETQVDLNERYYIYNVDMSNANPSKFNVYVDDKALGSEVIPSIPEEDDTSYRVAHIAIRSCKNYNVINKISKQLVNNELIFDESTNKLYIKTNNKIINIGASGGGTVPIPDDEDTIMTNQEIIKALEAQGIITITYVNPNLDSDEEKYAPSNIDKYSFNNIGSARFIHEETGKTYEFKTNAYGELESKLIENTSTLAEKLSGANIADDFKSVRGLIGQLGKHIASLAPYNKTINATADHGLFADRIRIGNVYAPLNTDVTYGCSHAFIELENTSNIDYNLTGCQLHFIKPEFSQTLNKFVFTKRSLELTGILPAGSTYLIRGKKYIENDNDSNCFIHVNTYDQEWYDNGELIDLTLTQNVMNVNTAENEKDNTCYIFILSYHGKYKSSNGYVDFLTINNNLYDLGTKEYTLSTINNDTDAAYLGDMQNISGSLKICDKNNGDTDDNAVDKSPLSYPKGFIDAIEIGATTRYAGSIKVGSDTYTISTFNFTSNCLYKGTYELDPAKQAFNGFTMRDSSRCRWAKKGNDYQYIKLNKEAIEFPKSITKRLVEYYSPKASFEHKNVISDKTKPDYNKPNAVSVSFGQNVYTTRCFNWISTSNTDEYVWIYDSSNNLLGKFESYKYTKTDIAQKTSFPRRKEFPKDVNNIVYCDYRENTIIDRDNYNKDVTYSKYAKAPRCCGLFAGSNDFFTAHKCIVDIVENPVVGEEAKYSYIVGQADKNGNPNEEHCSERRYFTLYPETYKPVIYQITDQQGFHWIEYQVWAAVANDLNNKIIADEAAAKSNGKPIMPIIINTGDMTQSGSRVNEWLDYYIAGDSLFNHYEQVNITGNNDLNGTDIQSLGTGDDPGKSNPYYYYVFNCNEINNFFTDESGDHYPIVNKTYVPSFYYIDTKDLRIVLVNSEITVINCRDWYNLRKQLTYNNSSKEYNVNIYTGFSLRGKDSVIEKYVANDIENFTPLYTLLWHALDKNENGNKKCIVACHEMPYTVITQACCSESEQIKRFRSISDAASGKLIGSHLNQIDATEDGAGVYWFSRLLESKGVKLCIGGHKHTYAITYPVRENYKYYVDGEWKTSKFDGPMEMPSSLQFEERQDGYKVLWSWKPNVNGENPRAEYQWYKNDQNADNNYGDADNEVINWSKFPLAYRGNNRIETMPQNGTFYPVTALYENDRFINNAVTYVMSQATGYKLTSNKELPTPNQKFSRIIPMTNNSVVDNIKVDTPNNNQKFPMYVKYVISKSNDNIGCDVFLGRATNIFNAKYKFDMSTYNSNPIKWHYLIDKSQYDQSNDINNIQYVQEYDSNNTSNLESVKENATVYDNYGLWLDKEKKMIETIIL